ncbi:ROK family protein [Clostridium fungisolvens]|uniref:Beta-glucoside kinase n=1 Tax=Clostridium fungisolvens TaxID=1604897 RepID=A0A6V8STU1_9CLOT|nr:ROK family protein [Clostridium fungisolvens]GFP78323.1 Beta-glucoside kinase [Clostridium fungisolvens]
MSILTFDIGGTTIKYGVLDRSGNIHEKGKFNTPKEDIDALISGLVDIKEAYEGRYDFEGIAMSCPGAVNDSAGMIGGASAVPCIHGFNIKEKIGKATGITNIRMENDANCAALAEVWVGAAKDNKDVLFVILGSGVGGAVIKDKKIHKGANLHGGEFGYMITSEEYTTLSSVATPVHMAASYAKAKGVNESSIDGEQVFKLAEAGDKIAKYEVKRFYKNLAIGIYNIQYVYDPEVIVIGGGISIREDLIDNIELAMDELMTAVEIAKVRPIVRRCEYMNDSNLIGAVYNYIN